MDSGWGYESLTEHTEVPGTGIEVLQDSQVPGTGMEVLQNSQKFRVGIRMFYPYPGYCDTGVQNLQKFGYGYECRPELTEVPGTGMDLVQNSQKFRVRVVPGKIPVSRGRKNYDNW